MSNRPGCPFGVLVLVGLLAAMILLAAGVISPAIAQEATAQPIPTAFDPRGGGSEPGLVGAPLLAALVVIGLGVAAAALTALYVRLGSRRRPN